MVRDYFSKLNHVCLTQASEISINFMQNSRLQGGFCEGIYDSHTVLYCKHVGSVEKPSQSCFNSRCWWLTPVFFPCSPWDFRPGVHQRRVLLHGTTRSVFAGCHASRAENHGSKDYHAPPVGTSGKGDWSGRLLIKGKGVVFF